MTDIPNTEYITINKDGVFVGGKPATTYRGEKILCIDDVREFFKIIQKTHPNIAELHVLSSETLGCYAVAGNPSGKYGSNPWCRVVLNDGTVGSWIFHSAYFVNTYCASYGVHGCAFYLCAHPEFSAAVLEQKTQKPINPVVVATNDEAQIKRSKGNTMYIKEVVRAPYICTVPGGGVRAIKCYPDAQTYIINGKKVGYSAKEQTVIVPLDVPGKEIEEIKVKISRIIESSKKVANTAANNEAQIKR